MADQVLTFCASTEPIYCAPPGDGLIFGCFYDGGRLVFATQSQPLYLPPAGDALVFGCPGLPEVSVSGVTLTGQFDVAGQAVATLAFAGRVIGDLSLSGATSASGVLHAVASGAVSLLGSARASLACRLTLQGSLSLSCSAHAVTAVPVAAGGDLSLSGSAYYAPSWYSLRPLASHVGAGWSRQDLFDRDLPVPHVQAALKNNQVTGSWDELEVIDKSQAGGWEQVPKVENQTLSPWGDLQQRPQATVAQGYSSPANKQREELQLPWGDMQTVGRSVAAEYAHPDRNDVQRSIPWEMFDTLQRQLKCDYAFPAIKDLFKPIVSGPYWYPRWCVRRYNAPNGAALLFDFPASVGVLPDGNALIFNYDSGDDPLICFDGTWNGSKDAYWYHTHEWNISTPDIRSYYIVMNTVSLKRVSDGAAIPIMGMEIGTDLDSWCWNLSATLRREVDLDLVRPAGGAPVEVEASINGNTWRFVIESYGHDRAYGQRGYSIAGRSLSAYLADPYSLPTSLLQASQMTAAQLADAALAGTGFTSNWQLTDWLVPSGVYSVSNQTPIQQLLTIAAAAGGTVQSAMSATTISLQPRYAAMPWEWGGATVEATLPSYQSKRTSFEARPQYSGVYVSGQSQGVICFVKRSGSDGSDQPQMQTDALITATEAGLAKGKRILADSGPRSVESIVAPLFDNPGLLKPGMLIDVVDGGSTWRGMVNSCRISAQRPTVSQSIDVLRYHGS